MPKQSDTTKQITDWLTRLANYKDNGARDELAYHQYYETVGFAIKKIEDMGVDALEGLVENLNHKDPKVRKIVIPLLAKIDDDSVLDYLTYQLEAEKDPALKQLLTSRIEAIKNPNPSPQKLTKAPKKDDEKSDQSGGVFGKLKSLFTGDDESDDPPKRNLDQEIVKRIIAKIRYVDGVGTTSSQIYNDEIGVVIAFAKRHPYEALEACKRTHGKTAGYVQREVKKSLTDK